MESGEAVDVPDVLERTNRLVRLRSSDQVVIVPLGPDMYARMRTSVHIAMTNVEEHMYSKTVYLAGTVVVILRKFEATFDLFVEDHQGRTWKIVPVFRSSNEETPTDG